MELRWKVNGKTGKSPIVPGINRIYVDVDQNEIAETVEAWMSIEHADKMFFNGFQTWTHCPEYTPYDRIRGLNGLPKVGVDILALDRFADYHFVNYPNKKGILHGFSYCYFRKGNHYRLLASLNEINGYTVFTCYSFRNLLKIERDCKGCAFQTTSFPAFELFYAEGNEEEVFRQWFNVLEINQSSPKIKGYSSWYNHYQNINEKNILEDFIGACKIFSEGDLFQIDDGWEQFVGDWENADPDKFRNGMKPITDLIHTAGFKAGLWLAPFVCEKKSSIYKKHPDWLLKYNGKPWKNGPNWSGFYSLDIDNPDVIEYLKTVFSRVFNEWGFDLVKLDFLYGASPLPTGDHGLGSSLPYKESRAGRMIRAMRLLRELCGNKLIIGCGVPVMPAFGLVDYCRVGCDVGLDWDDLPFMRILHRERVSTRQSVHNTIFRRQLNGKAYGNDPDVFFLRDKNIQLSEMEKTWLASIDALLGSVWLTSDDLNEYDDKKISEYNRLVHLRDAENICVDPDNFEVSFTLDGISQILRPPHAL